MIKKGVLELSHQSSGYGRELTHGSSPVGNSLKDVVEVCLDHCLTWLFWQLCYLSKISSFFLPEAILDNAKNDKMIRYFDKININTKYILNPELAL